MDLTQFEGHTPGPWRAASWDAAAPRPDDPAIMAGDEPVVSLMWYDGPVLAVSEPDARLIAAAPDLLALCRELRIENARLKGLQRYHAQRRLENASGKGCPGPGREAEELRKGLEAMTNGATKDEIQALLDRVDARDALAYLEERDRAEDALLAACELANREAATAESNARLAAEERARADRLARILAVERGDASAAPSGWERGDDCYDVQHWLGPERSRPYGQDYGSVVIRRSYSSAARWEWETYRDYERLTGTADTALEAIEAADAARGE